MRNKRHNECLFCTSRRCRTHIYSVSDDWATYNEVACWNHGTDNGVIQQDGPMTLEDIDEIRRERDSAIDGVVRLMGQIDAITRTHRRSLQIIEEKRSQISKMELEIEELSRIEGQMECLQRAHVTGLQILDDKYAEISDLKKQIAELKGE